MTMYSILYVDDEPELLELGKLFLERSGDMQVDTVVSPFGALELLASGNYDCIISDYMMPEMDGIGLLKEVRSGTGKIPFILFTGRGREDVVIEALNFGADFYLQKGGNPVAQFAELVHKVRTAIEHHHSIEALKDSEETLRESEKLYRTIFETTGTAMVVLEDSTVISLANTKFEELSGCRKSEIEGQRKWTEFVVKEDLERMLALHQMRLKNEGSPPNQYEFRFLRPDGDIRNIFLTINMIPGSKRYVASLMDITGWKKMEAELNRAGKEGGPASPGPRKTG
jgi:PAS domain S-box-containing protein